VSSAIAAAIAGGTVGDATNRIINGCARSNVRGASTAADGAYIADRWYALASTGSLSYSRQTDPENGQAFCHRIVQPDVSAKYVGFAQAIESVDCRDLRGQAVAFSFRVRSSVTGNIRYAILEHTGTADSITRDVVSNWSSTTYTPGDFFINTNLAVASSGVSGVTAGTWAQVNLVATLGSTFNNLIVMIWSEGTLPQSASIDLGNLSLTKGNAVRVFDPAPASVLGAQVGRFYQKSTDGLVAGYAGASGTVFNSVSLPYTMRTAATGSTLSGQSYSNASGLTVNSAAVDRITFQITVTSAGTAYCTFTYEIDKEL
jgi:hypothetical protein